jgi:hypothetical protein
MCEICHQIKANFGSVACDMKKNEIPQTNTARQNQPQRRFSNSFPRENIKTDMNRLVAAMDNPAIHA